LEKLDNAGFGKDELDTLKKLIDAEKSDLFDVLKYVFDSNFQPITRQNRAFKAKAKIWLSLKLGNSPNRLFKNSSAEIGLPSTFQKEVATMC
jgi:hypothetical protein